MATSTSTTPPAGKSSGGWDLSEACREVRLGLVVYGGVSLAIYINGVGEELFRAVRGRGIYKLLKRLLDSDIVVDIVSGTSAGGINGLFLAYALTNEYEFSDCAALWREQGAISKLLRLVDDDINATSLLDTKNYYLPQLEGAFRSMDPISEDVRKKERVSEFDELDLFVTGTNFDGTLTTTVDATGRQIDIKTHRAVFHLKHRAGRKEPFKFSNASRSREERALVAALARLAAITSCFPAAFEPVKVAPGPPHSLENDVYEKLKEWGALNDGESWFLDGGVLDNKPFSYTIHEIFNRTASRPVDRKLFYVEPDPERFSKSDRPARTQPPSVVRAAVDALVGIPGYESIAEDLEQIAKRNDRLQRQNGARRAAEAAFASLSESRGGAATIPRSVAAVYRHTRLAQLSDKAIKGLLENEGFTRSLNADQPSAEDRKAIEGKKQTATTLAKAFDQWQGEGGTTLERYDVYMRKRRVFHVIYKVFGRVSTICDEAVASENAAANAGARATRLKAAWETLNAQLGAYEIIESALERVIDGHRMPVLADEQSASHVWKKLAEKFDYLLQVDAETAHFFDGSGFSEAQRNALHKTLRSRVDELSKEFLPLKTQTSGGNLLQQLDAQTQRLLAEQVDPEHDEVLNAWNDFVWFDAHFFPIDYFGDLAEKDAIDVVRISPLDADRAFSRRKFEDKVTGETVMHFGAFLKKSWRANDIMWGRLDGVCRILDSLLTRESLARAVGNPAVRKLIARDLASGALDPAELFPNCGPKIQDEVRGWLHRLSSDDKPVREAALDGEKNPQGETKYDLLLWCAQLEILNDSLPTVLKAAASEQLEWNHIDTGKRFEPTGLRVDLSAAVVSGEELTQKFLERLQGNREFTSIPEAPLSKYFLKQYGIGAENVRDNIPPAVLAETITSALLVTRNCLVNAFPEHAKPLTSNIFYRAVIDWPLRVAHTLAVMARRERPFYFGVMAALITYALVALFGGLFWLRVNLKEGDHFDNTKVVLLVVLPLVILIPGMYLAAQWVFRHTGRSWFAFLAKTAVAGAAFASVLLLGLAFGAAWENTNAQLVDWIRTAVNHPRITAWNGGAPLQVPRWLALYPLVALVVVFVFGIPALRGFVQARVARRSARFGVGDALQTGIGETRRITNLAVDAARQRLGRA